MTYKMCKKALIIILANFVTASLTGNEKDSNLQSNEFGVDFVKDCPTLKNIIRDNNITEYSLECNYSPENYDKITEENVLRFACVIVKHLLSYVCDKKISVPQNLFNLTANSNLSICPFDFKQLDKYILLELGKLGKELTITKQCMKICYDLYELKRQCIILKNVYEFVIGNNYSNESFQKERKLDKASSSPAEFLSDYVDKTEEYFKLKEKPIAEESTSRKIHNFTSKLDVKKPSMIDFTKPLESSFKADQQSPYVKPIEKLSQDLFEASKPSDDLLLKMTKPAATNKENMKNSTGGLSLISEENQFKNENQMKDYDSGNYATINDISELDHFSEIQEPNQSLVKENKISIHKESFRESLTTNEISGKDFFQAEDSHFFFYFLMLSSVVIIGYLAFHNKNKILAYALEGSSNKRNRRRPNSSRYRKLESNLEEAISSTSMQSAASTVVY